MTNSSSCIAKSKHYVSVRTAEFFEGLLNDDFIEDEVGSKDCDDKGGGGEGKIWQIRG